MDIDENDMLSTNKFIPTPELNGEVPEDMNDEFRKYYRREVEQSEERQLRDSLERTSIRSINLDENTDAHSMMNTNPFNNKEGTPSGSFSLKRAKKEVITYVNVDSRDRNKTLYSKPSYFKIFLGKTYYNVKKIRLASIEFPNTDAVISSKNNKIYWRNKEDVDNDVIDTVTKTYPVYEVACRTGSYIAPTLQTELITELDTVKRLNKTGDFHYFEVTLDLNTDIVKFVSLTLTQLPVNPLSVTIGLGLVTVNSPNHGHTTGDIVYIIGATTIAGIPSTTINGAQTITVINPSSFQFEINTKASATALGGGSNMKSGKLAPFQLLFGEYSNTIAQNIGYPLENSSQRINTYIKSIDNIYLLQVVTSTPHGFSNTYDYIGQTVTFAGTDVNPSADGTRVIANIIDTTTFLVIFNTKVAYPSFNTGTVTFNGQTLNIASLTNYSINTCLVTTFTNHAYNFTHIGSTITFYNTKTTPSFDQTNTIYGILSPTEFIISGSVLSGGASYVTNPGDGGSMPRNDPLTTKTVVITGVVPGNITTLTVPNHGVKAGETICVYNLATTPPMITKTSGIYTVNTVPDANTITINFATTSYDASVISAGTAYIGTSIVTVSFPYHGFNNIISITNGFTPLTIISITDVTVSPPNYQVAIQTSSPHGLTTGQTVKILSSNSTPSVDGYGYTITVTAPDTFTVPFTQSLSLNGSSGTVNLDPQILQIQTLLPHNLQTGNTVRVMQTNCVPAIDGGGYTVTVLSSDTFTIQYGPGITSAGTKGIVGMNQNFYLYGASAVGGITADVLNSNKYTVRDIIDANTFNFSANNFATTTEQGGGTNVYINSLLHGFNGVQDNTKNDLLNRSINLEGENYAFLCCPQLATMANTGTVTNIFARILLDQSPGHMVFSFLSNPKEFDTVPLDQLSELEFSVVTYSNTAYEFFDLDFSFVLEITEVKDTVESFNVSSKRGVHNL